MPSSKAPLAEFVASLRTSVRAMVLGFRIPAIFLLAIVSLGAWVLAYQVKTAYTVDVGGLDDDAYVTGFHDKEPKNSSTLPSDVNYRWSMGDSRMFLPGIGNEPVQLTVRLAGCRPAPPLPQVTLAARGQTFALQATCVPTDFTFFVDRGSKWYGDFDLSIASPTYRPADLDPNKQGDTRNLGVTVYWVRVAPASTGLRPVVIPPVDTLLMLLWGVVASYLAGLIATRRVLLATLFAGLIALLTTAEIVFFRPEMGFHALQLPSLWVWGLLFAFLSRATLDTALSTFPASRPYLAAAGSAAFVAAFMLRFGGLTYPQFRSSDLIFHVHNVQHVLDGRWAFESALPDGTPVPYPPAYYVILSPLTFLFGRSDEAISMLLKWSASLLDSLTCLALVWSGARLGWLRAGALAALVYAFFPAAFDLFSAGNYSNLFAQSVLNVTLLAGMVYLGRRAGLSGRHWLLMLFAGFALTMLGHYGMMLGTLFVAGLFAVWVAVQAVRGMRPTASIALLATVLAGLLASVAAYYWLFFGDVWAHLSGVVSRALGGSRSTAPKVPGQPLDVMLRKLVERMERLVGFVPFVGTTTAAFLGGVRGAPRALLAAWLLAGAIFILLDQLLGDAIRGYYLVAGAAALLTGRFLALLLSRGRAGPLLAGLGLAFMALHLLAYWIGDLIFTAYH